MLSSDPLNVNENHREDLDIDAVIGDVMNGQPLFAGLAKKSTITTNLSSSRDESSGYIEKMTKAWMNEKSCPEILPYEDSLLDLLHQFVERQIELIDDYSSNEHRMLVLPLIQLEVERVKFLMRSYLRTRLIKIEKYARYFLKESNYNDRMHETEVTFAGKYLEISDRLFQKSFISRLPESLQSLDDEQQASLSMVPKPDLDAAVFCKPLKELGEVTLDFNKDIAVDMTTEKTFLTRYRYIQNYVQLNEIQLL